MWVLRCGYTAGEECAMRISSAGKEYPNCFRVNDSRMPQLRIAAKSVRLNWFGEVVFLEGRMEWHEGGDIVPGRSFTIRKQRIGDLVSEDLAMLFVSRRGRVKCWVGKYLRDLMNSLSRISIRQYARV